MRRRGSLTIAEKKPEVLDQKTPAQLAQRLMWQQCTAFWNLLSDLEKKQWEALARPQHMPGYALWMSSCLKPNPGIYLPLAGGQMTGNITMAGAQTVDGVDISAHAAATAAHGVAGTIAGIADIATHAALKTGVHGLAIGARVYNNANLTIPKTTVTALTFNSQRYDTDTIHDTVTNPSRLTCKTAGKYIIVGHVAWANVATGEREIRIQHNIGGTIGNIWCLGTASYYQYVTVAAIYDLAINEYVELTAYQDTTGNVNILVLGNMSPEFEMQRIG